MREALAREVGKERAATQEIESAGALLFPPIAASASGSPMTRA